MANKDEITSIATIVDDMDKISCKSARVEAGLTQEAAALAIGVSRATLKNYETGKTYPKQPVIERMCAVYKRPYDRIKFNI